MPHAPPGTLVAVHIKPNKRKSWDPHLKRGWYVGPSLSHYRNFRIFLPSTKSEIVSDTVNLFADAEEIPTISHEEFIQQALMDILAVLQTKQKINVPSLHYGEKINDAIILVSELLGRKNTQPIIQSPSKPSPIDPPEENLAHISKLHPFHVSKNTVQSPRVKNFSSKLPTLPRVHTTKMSTPTQPSYKALAAQYINIVETFKFKMHHIYNSHGKKETLNSLLQQNSEIWGMALSNEWGRLAQGNDYGIIGTDTIEFILKSEVPHGRDVTYASFVCDKRPLKTEPFRVRIVVGGDRLSFDDDAGSPATDLLETQVLLNSTISDSDQGARFYLQI